MIVMSQNFNFEKSHWDEKKGRSCEARYMMDTVLHHEEGTSALYRINKYLQHVKGLTLEVGMNCGGVSMTIAKVADFVVGVDFMSYAVKVANQKMHDLNNDIYPESEEQWCHKPDWKPTNCMWICASGLALPLKSEAFDTVLYPEFIEHIPKENRQQLINDAFRLTKPQGQFIYSTPTDVHDPNKPNWMEEILRDVHPFGLESKESSVAMISKAGFEILEVENEWHDKIQVLYVRAIKK